MTDQKVGQERREGERRSERCWWDRTPLRVQEVLVQSTEEFERVKFESFSGKEGKRRSETETVQVWS